MQSRRIVTVLGAAAAATAVGATALAGPASAATPKVVHKQFSVITKSVSEKDSKTGFVTKENVYTPSGKLVGHDTLSCRITSTKSFTAKCTVVFTFLAHKADSLSAHVTLTGDSPAATATVYAGTGTYKGFTGKAYALSFVSDKDGTAITFVLHK